MANASPCYGRLVRIDKKDGASFKLNTDRIDGRTAAEDLRPIFLRNAVLSGAAGSSYFEAGGTKVFAAVFGPRPSPSSNAVEASVVCDVRWADFGRSRGSTAQEGERRNPAVSDFATDEEREFAAMLTRTLTATIRLDSYPKSRIEVSAFVLEDDGSAFAAVITAAVMALADAGVEIRDLVSSSCAALLDGKLVLDPCADEEKKADGTVMLAYMPTFALVTDVIQTGEMELHQVTEALRLCSSSAAKISELMRTALTKHARKLLKKRKARIAS